MTWGLGSNVLPIILLSVKFMIVLLLEKIEKRIHDYNVVEISLQNFSLKTFKSSVWKKMVIYVSLKIFFVNKLSTHPGKNIMVVNHLLKDSGKFSWKVNGTRLFGSFQRKISGRNRTSEKVVLFFPTEYFKQKFVFHSSKPSLIPVSGLRSRFPINGTDSYNVVNAIPGRNLPVLNFAYHLPKPWSDRFAHREW